MQRIRLFAGRMLQPFAERHPDDRQHPNRTQVRLERGQPHDLQPDRFFVGTGVDEPFPDARFQGLERCPRRLRDLFVGTGRRNRNTSRLFENHRGVLAGGPLREAGLPRLRRYPGNRLRHLPQRQYRTASRRQGYKFRRPEEHRIDRRHARAVGRDRPRPVQPRRVSLADTDRRIPGCHRLEQQPGFRNRHHSLPEKQLPGQPALRPQRRERQRVLLPQRGPLFERAARIQRIRFHDRIRPFHGNGTRHDGKGALQRPMAESLRMCPRSLVGKRTQPVDSPAELSEKRTETTARPRRNGDDEHLGRPQPGHEGE